MQSFKSKCIDWQRVLFDYGSQELGEERCVQIKPPNFSSSKFNSDNFFDADVVRVVFPLLHGMKCSYAYSPPLSPCMTERPMILSHESP
jgi:hypothetical protein